MKIKKQYLAKRLSLFNVDIVGATNGGIETLHSGLLDLLNENIESGINPKTYVTDEEKMRQGSVLVDSDLPYNEQIAFDILHTDIGSRIYNGSLFNDKLEDSEAWFIYKNLLFASMNGIIFIQLGDLSMGSNSCDRSILPIGEKIKEVGILPVMEYDIVKDFWQDYHGKVLELVKKVAEVEKQMHLIKKLHPQNISGLYLGNAFNILGPSFTFDFVVESSLNPINTPIDFTEYIHILQNFPKLKGNGKVLILRKGNPISEYLIHYNKALKRIDRNTVTFSI